MEESTISRPRVSMKSLVQEGIIADEGGVNGQCHDYTGGVKANNARIISNPGIVLILWGNYYNIRADALTSAQTLMTDLVTGAFMNGLAQYGVAPGSLVSSVVIDTNAQNPAPKTIDENQLQDKLINWIKAGTVSPTPSVNEANLLYFIFPPTDTQLTLTDGKTNFCGYHKHAKYHHNESSNDDLFWAVVGTNGANQTNGNTLIHSVSYCVSHELVEAFSNCDDQGFHADNGCEIADICETKTFFPNYRGWIVEQYWSNWDNSCIQGSQPVSLHKFLGSIGFDFSKGLRSLNTPVINIHYIASRKR